MLTNQSFAKALSLFCILTFPFYLLADCAPVIQNPNTRLILNYAGEDLPANISSIDVDFPEKAKNGINGTYVQSTWQTSGTNFSGVTLTGDVTIHFDDGSPSITCNYIEGEYNDPLAVELHEFNGLRYQNDIHLSWATLNETQNAGFEIERSFDGERFTTIGSVAGAGYSEEKQDYSYVDIDVRSIALGGNAYYRLKQMDFDGKFVYSSVTSVDLGLEIEGFKITKITGWNNPEKRLKIHFHNPAQVRKINMLVSDISGTVFKNASFYPAPGFQSIELDLSDLKDQLYVISLNNGKSIISKKIVLQSF